MIFITLGTQDKHFDRLLNAVYKLETDEKIVAQIGSTGKNLKFINFCLMKNSKNIWMKLEL